MSQVSKLFDIRSKKYNQIYEDVLSKNLLHQEKKVRSRVVEGLVQAILPPSKEGILVAG